MVSFQSVIVLFCNVYNVWCNLIYYLYSNVIELDLLRKSLKACEDSIGYDDKNLRVYVVKAEVLVKLNRREAALESLQQALDLTDTCCDLRTVSEIHRMIKTLACDKTSDTHTETAVAPVPGPVGPTSVAAAVPAPKPVLLPPPPAAKESTKKEPKLGAGVGSVSPAQPAAALAKGKPNGRPPITRAVLCQAHTQLLGQLLGDSRAHYLNSVRSNLSHASGDNIVDDLIALGYLQVNTGNLAAACELFELLLSYRRDLPAAFLALGSAKALLRRFDEALDAFTSCLGIDSKMADAWKRRGQVYTAKGMPAAALADINRALALNDLDPDTFMQRGLTLHMIKDYRAALSDFRTVLQKDPATYSKHPLLFNYAGMCEAQLGNLGLAMASYRSAMELDTSFKEAHMNYAQMLKEEGRYREADTAFAVAERVVQASIGGGGEGQSATPVNTPKGLPPVATAAKSMCSLLAHRSSMYYALGDPLRALQDYLTIDKCAAEFTRHLAPMKHLITDDASADFSIPEAVQNKVNIALCLHGMGCFARAAQAYNTVLASDPNHACWFQKQVLFYTWRLLDTPLDLFNLDHEVLPVLKDAYVKRLSYKYYSVLLNLLRSNSHSSKSSVGNFMCQNTSNATSPAENGFSGGSKRGKGKDMAGDTRSISTAELHDQVSSLMVPEPRKGTDKAPQLPPNIGHSHPVALDGTPVADIHTGQESVRALPCHGDQNTGSGSDGGGGVLPLSLPSDKAGGAPSNEVLLQVVRATRRFGRWIQLDARGFVPNARQHVQFGCAAVEMARLLRKHATCRAGLLKCANLHSPLLMSATDRGVGGGAPRAVDGSGYLVSNARASANANGYKSRTSVLVVNQTRRSVGECAKKQAGVADYATTPAVPGTHLCCWRDFMDISVRWRQISEPNDGVWWIDRFPLQSVVEGFGLQTPLVNGQLKTIRYFSYYPQALQVLSALLQDGFYYSASNEKKTLSKHKLKQILAVISLSQTQAQAQAQAQESMAGAVLTGGSGASSSGRGATPSSSSSSPSSSASAPPGDASELAEIHRVIGEDFYVISPCYNTDPRSWGSGSGGKSPVPDAPSEDLAGPEHRDRRRKTEGTRLTLVRRDPGGFEFTIRTPCTPSRLAYFEQELTVCMADLSVCVAAVLQAGWTGFSEVGDDEEPVVSSDHATPMSLHPVPPAALSELANRVLRKALELFYLWVNFAPLSRGSAACGYAALESAVLAINHMFRRPLPRAVQLDWEAIFTPHCEDFIARVIDWLPICPLDDGSSGSGTDCTGTVAGSALVDGIPMEEVCCNYRSMIRLLSFPKFPENHRYGDAPAVV